MRKLSIYLLMLLFMLTMPAWAASIEFNQKQWQQIEAKYSGKRWMLLLWSVECPPCFKELAVIGQLAKERPNLPVVIINTDDDDSLSADRQEILAKYQLQDFTNLHFADSKATPSRMLIDSNWYGELPRSYFYAADGKRKGLSGLLNAAKLRRWLL